MARKPDPKPAAAHDRAHAPANDHVTGPWIAPEKVPPVLRQFQENRDPLIKAQLQDLEKSEAQRREESGRGSAMVGQEKPKLNARPPEEMGRASDRNSFNERWLVEQRDAVLDQAKRQQGPAREGPAHQPGPSREPSR